MRVRRALAQKGCGLSRWSCSEVHSHKLICPAGPYFSHLRPDDQIHKRESNGDTRSRDAWVLRLGKVAITNRDPVGVPVNSPAKQTILQ
jgi:hypothetical protein